MNIRILAESLEEPELSRLVGHCNRAQHSYPEIGVVIVSTDEAEAICQVDAEPKPGEAVLALVNGPFEPSQYHCIIGLLRDEPPLYLIANKRFLGRPVNGKGSKLRKVVSILAGASDRIPAEKPGSHLRLIGPEE